MAAKTWSTWKTALTGNVKAANPAAGAYLGTGVATGGQQGKTAVVNSGIGGVKSGGGMTAGASPPAMASPMAKTKLSAVPARSSTAPTSPPRPSVTAGPGMTWAPFKATWVDPKNPMHKVEYVRAWHKVATAPTGPGVKPPLLPPGTPPPGEPNGPGENQNLDPMAPVDPNATPADPMAWMEDSQYWMDDWQNQSQFDQQADPLKARAANLNRDLGGAYSGMTMYDKLYKEAQSEYDRTRRHTQAGMNQNGLLRSGRHDLAIGNDARAFYGKNLDLSQQWGDLAKGDIAQQLGSAQQQYINGLRSQAMAAVERARANGTQISNQSMQALQDMLDKYSAASLPVQLGGSQ